ncbi:MAG TPA: carbamoyltransferase C-terminal domain-containing protein [Candidatus Solibacter sp.]|nr:carbamoyltransferase C-terminal domain-containing protein [Candidatus Solibacter sp.]
MTGAPRREVRFSVFAGPEYTEAEIETVLAQQRGIGYSRPPDVASFAAQRLAAGEILGWFHGHMEYGPRGLGHCSILASPLLKDMRNVVNDRIKHRERFRPFAGAVPLEHAREFFELENHSPYMQFVVSVRESALERIPAVVHFRTCRAQAVDHFENPLFHKLLLEFGKQTGCPVLLNTSFNDADEPIVYSPTDAVRTFLNTKLDRLVIGGFVVERERHTECPLPRRLGWRAALNRFRLDYRQSGSSAGPEVGFGEIARDVSEARFRAKFRFADPPVVK